MARSEGAVVGVTFRTAAVPDELTSGSVTFLTPLVVLEIVAQVLRRGSVAV